MKAAVLRTLGEPLQLEDLTVPSLGPGHVLVGMQMAGVCQSQKLEISGHRGPDRYLPHLVGHEGVGIVLDVGPGVTKVKPKSQVVISWIRGSGEPCGPIVYQGARGPVNAGPVATFCETPIISQQCLVPLEKPVDPELAVLAGCALPTGAGTVWNAMPADAKGSICILGAGGVGLSAVAGAAYAGWGQIIVVDLRPSPLQRATELGATHTVDARKNDAEKEILSLTGGKGSDLVLECAGATQTMEMAVRLAKPKGGKIVIAGNLATGTKISVNPFDFIQGRWLGGSWGGWVNPDQDIPKMVDLCRQGSIRYRLLRGQTYPLDRVNEALAALSGDYPGRPILQFYPSELAT